MLPYILLRLFNFWYSAEFPTPNMFPRQRRINMAEHQLAVDGPLNYCRGGNSNSVFGTKKLFAKHYYSTVHTLGCFMVGLQFSAHHPFPACWLHLGWSNGGSCQISLIKIVCVPWQGVGQCMQCVCQPFFPISFDVLPTISEYKPSSSMFAEFKRQVRILGPS